MNTNKLSQETYPLPNADQVAQYLLKHPEFFSDYLQLLTVIKIPHPSGVAVSLVSRQLEVLREKNNKMENQLEELIDIARENDQHYEKLHRLTLRLIGVESLNVMMRVLEQELRDCFLADCIVLYLPKSEVFPDLPENISVIPTAFALDENKSALLTTTLPYCGLPTETMQSLFLDHSQHPIGSCALLVLHGDQFSGLLGIGSFDSERFSPDLGQRFLQRMGELITTYLAVFAKPCK